MDKEKVLSLISDEHNLIMANPFPYEGTRKIKVDFERDFLLLEDENLNADFNDYCTVIVGTTSYILEGIFDKIPERQIELLTYIQFF